MLCATLAQILSWTMDVLFSGFFSLSLSSNDRLWISQINTQSFHVLFCLSLKTWTPESIHVLSVFFLKVTVETHMFFLPASFSLLKWARLQMIQDLLWTLLYPFCISFSKHEVNGHALSVFRLKHTNIMHMICSLFSGLFLSLQMIGFEHLKYTDYNSMFFVFLISKSRRFKDMLSLFSAWNTRIQCIWPVLCFLAPSYLCKYVRLWMLQRMAFEHPCYFQIATPESQSQPAHVPPVGRLKIPTYMRMICASLSQDL